MHSIRFFLLWLMPALILSDPVPPTAGKNEHVVLLHGLCRTTSSMKKMAKSLTEAGYTVHNLSYPTRTKTVDQLASEHLDPLLSRDELKTANKVHFVTHSLGSIVLRQQLKGQAPHNLGKIVFLGPPSRGSHVVDKIGHWKLFKRLNGPAGNQLSCDEHSAPNQLGPLHHEHAVIAGNRSINWINSLMIPGPDDGKVAVSHTTLPDTQTHLVVPATHPYLMKNPQVIRETLHYLRSGRFSAGSR